MQQQLAMQQRMCCLPTITAPIRPAAHNSSSSSSRRCAGGLASCSTRQFARPCVRVRVASPAREQAQEDSGSTSSSRRQPKHRQQQEAGAPSVVLPSAEGVVWPDEQEGDCPVFVGRDGEFVQVMCCDYGFRTATGQLYQDGLGGIPSSAWSLAWDNFKQEWLQLRRSFRYNEYARIAALNPPQGPVGKLTYAAGSAVVSLFARVDAWLEAKRLFTTLLPVTFPDSVMDMRTGSIKGECREIRGKLKQLKLSNAAVWAREHAREAAGGGVDTPWLVKGAYLALCGFLDVAFDNRPIARFWFLETVARMPYFGFMTVLHLYETLGWWRAGSELRKVHFAEELNELTHLRIMESLGGDQLWPDRFMAQHAAVIYFFILLLLYVTSPSLAYNFSELIEAHAVDTYGEFADANEALLKTLPPPYVAAQYYLAGDLYYFDNFQTSSARSGGPPRRPPCANLHDVFLAIRDDEGEHVKTMAACQDGTVVMDLRARRDASDDNSE